MAYTFKEAKTEIQVTRARGGEYWTNIVGCILRQVDAELGIAEANRLIRECKLKECGWQEEDETP